MGQVKLAIFVQILSTSDLFLQSFYANCYKYLSRTEVRMIE